MAEYFIAVNYNRKEFIDPGSIGLPYYLDSLHNFPMSGLLIYLMSTPISYEPKYKNQPNFFKGMWYYNLVAIIGDETRELEFQRVGEEFKDITLEAMKDYRNSNLIFSDMELSYIDKLIDAEEERRLLAEARENGELD